MLGIYKIGNALLKGDSVATLGADLVAAFLKPLLAGQDRTAAALNRIEATLDKQKIDSYRQRMNVGWGSLRDALVPGRSPEHRAQLLHTAQYEFRSAVWNAPTPSFAVDAQLLVAATWVAQREPQDAVGALAEAAELARQWVYEESRSYAQPDGVVEGVLSTQGVFGRLRRLGSDAISYDDPAMVAVRARFRAAARERRDAAAELLNEVHQLRLTYGEDAARCASVVGFYEPGYPMLSPVHAADAAGLGTSVSRGNTAVLAWPGPSIELDSIRLDLMDGPVVARAGDGWSTSVLVTGTPTAGPVRLWVSSDWPYDYRPDYRPALLPLSSAPAWDGHSSWLNEPTTFRACCFTPEPPRRLIVKQGSSSNRPMLMALREL